MGVCDDSQVEIGDACYTFGVYEDVDLCSGVHEQVYTTTQSSVLYSPLANRRERYLLHVNTRRLAKFRIATIGSAVRAQHDVIWRQLNSPIG